MSSFNENSSAENRGAIQEYPVNNTNINTYTIDLIREVTNLYNINMHYCTHCRSYVNHLAYNCNHTTLRIFDHELFKQKELLLDSPDEVYKIKAFEEFIYKFHSEIINGFYIKISGHEGVLPDIDIIVKHIIEYFWTPQIYTSDWELFNNMINNIGWYTDRIGDRTLIDRNNFIYPPTLSNNQLLNRIIMVNILMNELIINEQESVQFVNFVNNINNINIQAENIDDDLPELIDDNDPLAQALVETQSHTHFIENSCRKFSINLFLYIDTSLDAKEEKECKICYDLKTKNRFVKFNCKHECCANCIIQTMNNTNQYREMCCAFCRAQMTDFVISTEEDFQILQEKIV
jgi:hypothetical protein